MEMLDYPECPNCGKTACAEQDCKSMDTYIDCKHCGYYEENGKVINEGKEQENA